MWLLYKTIDIINLVCLLCTLNFPLQWWTFADNKFIGNLLMCLTKSGKSIPINQHPRHEPSIRYLLKGSIYMFMLSVFHIRPKKKTCLIALSRPTEIIEKSRSRFFFSFF